MEDLVPLLSGKSSSWVTLVSLWKTLVSLWKSSLGSWVTLVSLWKTLWKTLVSLWKSSLGSWVTLVSLWAGEQVAEVVQQVWAASHGTTCSQQPQSTLANYYQALPPPLSSS